MKRIWKALLLCSVLALFTGCPTPGQRASIDTPVDETLAVTEVAKDAK